MLREVDLTLGKTTAVEQTDEETRKQMNQMNADSSAESVDNIHNSKRQAQIIQQEQKKTNIITRKKSNQEMYSLRLRKSLEEMSCTWTEMLKIYIKKKHYSLVCMSIQEIEDIPPSDDSDYQIDSFTIVWEDKERT